MALSYIVSEIKRDIGRKSQLFRTPCIRRRRQEGYRRNIAIGFGVASRRWKQFEDKITRYGTIHERGGQQDRQT